MNTQDINGIICSILYEQFDVKDEFDDYSNLTSEPFCFSYVQMYEFLMCIENRLKIYLKPEDIQVDDFRSIHSIKEMIIRKKETMKD